jgi:hypothetical protein
VRYKEVLERNPDLLHEVLVTLIVPIVQIEKAALAMPEGAERNRLLKKMSETRTMFAELQGMLDEEGEEH